MKSQQTETTLNTETIPENFDHSQEIIDAFARRLLPEIKKYFAEESVQREFEKWREKQISIDGK